MGILLDPKWSGDGLNAIDAFHSLQKDTAEVIIYGSSHAWKGCDTKTMYRQHGLAAYNYGANWQALNTTLLFMQDSFRTQSPKVACVDTFYLDDVLHYTQMNGQIYYTRNIPFSREKLAYLRHCFGRNLESYVTYFMPLWMFHENWSEIKRENFVDNFSVEECIRNLGYSPDNSIQPAVLGDPDDFPQEELPDYTLNVLDSMVEACREKGVALLFYTCPYEGEFTYSDAIESYAKENGCAYLNLFAYTEEMDLNPNTDFRDPTHLNNTGAAKVADFLGRYISENYEMTDYRLQKDNLWEQYLQ